MSASQDRQSETPSAPPSQVPVIASRDDLYRAYFSAKGRMRLGQLKNPWVSSFLLMPITLFVYWSVWFDEAAREVAWHAEGGSVRQFMAPTWLAWIPGMHIYMTYRLAMGVRHMERQNGYHTISPALAALFSIVPPFAVAYLQEAMTRHWLLHVRQHHLSHRV